MLGKPNHPSSELVPWSTSPFRTYMTLRNPSGRGVSFRTKPAVVHRTDAYDLWMAFSAIRTAITWPSCARRLRPDPPRNIVFENGKRPPTIGGLFPTHLCEEASPLGVDEGLGLTLVLLEDGDHPGEPPLLPHLIHPGLEVVDVLVRGSGRTDPVA